MLVFAHKCGIIKAVKGTAGVLFDKFILTKGLHINMNNNTLGQRIAYYRGLKNLKQNEFADILGVSAQAVSKWENDISCPDISILPMLAQTLNVTIEELLTGAPKEPVVRQLTAEEQKQKKDRILRIIVDDLEGGDKIRVNLPIALVRVGLEMGLNMNDITANKGDDDGKKSSKMDMMKNINLDQLMCLIDEGAIGKLVEVESNDARVEIFVE